jgi:glucosamine--fructose-6-phosphate aminotransferase (isomerizing)
MRIVAVRSRRPIGTLRHVRDRRVRRGAAGDRRRIDDCAASSTAGYDSAGVAHVRRATAVRAKRAGKLANLEKALAEDTLPRRDHRRGAHPWATHGPPTDRNAHPHLDCTGKVAVVHNGIIENFALLRAELEAPATS